METGSAHQSLITGVVIPHSKEGAPIATRPAPQLLGNIQERGIALDGGKRWYVQEHGATAGPARRGDCVVGLNREWR
jgi:hypothetical protein